MVTFAVPFCSGYAAYVAISVLFGLFVAAYISLSSVVLVNLLGLDNLAWNHSRVRSATSASTDKVATGSFVPSYERLSGKCFKGLHAGERVVYNLLTHAFLEAFNSYPLM